MAFFQWLALVAWRKIPPSFRFLLYKQLLPLGIRLYGNQSLAMFQRVARLPFNIFLKLGTVEEAEVMRHLNVHTTVPTAVVLDWAPSPNGGDAFILMRRLPGRPIDRDIILGLTEVERADLGADLKRAFDELRSMPRPPQGTGVSGLYGGSFLSNRIKENEDLGPFSTLEAFHDCLFRSIQEDQHTRLREVARPVHNAPTRLVFTHGDLAIQNILVNERRRLVAIIDWECAAWLPKYWEYTHALRGRDQVTAWRSLVELALQPHPVELEIEMALWQYTWWA